MVRDGIYQANEDGTVSLLPDVTPAEQAAWEQDKGIQLVSGQIVAVPLTLSEAKTAKELEMRVKGSGLMEQVASPYTAEERDTWSTQVAEAKAYSNDPLTPTPMLDALCAQRGNTVADQVARIISNEAAFKVAVGTVLGIQQAKIDQIAAATTVDQVSAITWV